MIDIIISILVLNWGWPKGISWATDKNEDLSGVGPVA